MGDVERWRVVDDQGAAYEADAEREADGVWRAKFTADLSWPSGFGRNARAAVLYACVMAAVDAVEIVAPGEQTAARQVAAERDMWEAQIATTTTDAAEALDIVDDLVRYAMNTHPLPWRIEDDWTREVTAADGAIVAKCMTFARAEAIIAAAERIAADRAKHADDFAELDGAAS